MSEGLWDRLGQRMEKIEHFHFGVIRLQPLHQNPSFFSLSC